MQNFGDVARRLYIINIYRSQNATTDYFIKSLKKLVNLKKECHLLRDFNICSKSDKSHPIFSALRDLGFEQIIKKPTHIAGRCIDQLFLYTPSDGNRSNLKVTHESPFFTDHDILFIQKVSLPLTYISSLSMFSRNSISYLRTRRKNIRKLLLHTIWPLMINFNVFV